MSYILSIDQGTTGTRAMIFNKRGDEVGNSYKEHKQYYPNPGWVEHDPIEIRDNSTQVIKQVLLSSKIDISKIASIGITNQRETVIAWNNKTGTPVHNAIVWQCRRTADYCKELRETGYFDLFKERTGLVLDPYFSGTKIKWILDNIPKAKDLLDSNNLSVGTIDAWLIWNLIGKNITDYSNASRTLLFNIRKGEWDDELLDIIGVPRSILPEVRPSSDKETYGETHQNLFSSNVPISGNAGDQQAALFGQTCFEPGSVKNTYGTGNFLLQNTGNNIISSKNGLLSTIAWKIDETITYALEGSVFITGALLQWLEKGLGILNDAKDTTEIMNTTSDTLGVYLVPAFVGLGAPYWDPYARGIIVGITQSTSKNHIIRAGLESICYQSQDVLEAMEQDSGVPISVLRVDGGVSQCDPLLQFQSNISQITVQRPKIRETTALGAAYLAGLAIGYWESLDDIRANFLIDAEFKCAMNPDKNREMLEKWRLAVDRSKMWVTH